MKQGMYINVPFQLKGMNLSAAAGKAAEPVAASTVPKKTRPGTESPVTSDPNII